MISPPVARVGSRTPRVSSYPRTVSSAGIEAVELAETAGLYLDGWQQDVLINSLGETPNGKWAAFEVGLVVPRQCGKGAILEARELAGLFLFGERMIVHTSHEFKTSLEAYRRLRALIESTPDLDRKVKQYWQTTGYEGIELLNGARLRFLARSKGSGRGFSGDLVILDESFALTADQVDALLPTLSARPNPQLWYTSSPPLDGISGEPLHALRARGEAGADGLAWFDWGALPGVDIDDREVWAASNPALGIRITEERIALERAAMGAEGFGRERLGIWPATAAARWAVITEADWLALLDDASQATDPLVFAIDVTPERSHGSIAACGARADGDLHGEVIDHGQGTSWIVSRAAELNARWKPAAWIVDAGGAASFLIPLLEAEGLTVVTMSSRQVGQAYGMFRSATSSAEQGKAPESSEGLTGEPVGSLEEPVVVPKIKVRLNRHGAALTAAVEGAATRRVGDGTSWDRKSSNVVISPLVALTNAVFGFVTREIESDQPFFGRWA
jgi:hypothetical protein